MHYMKDKFVTHIFIEGYGTDGWTKSGKTAK